MNPGRRYQTRARDVFPLLELPAELVIMIFEWLAPQQDTDHKEWSPKNCTALSYLYKMCRVLRVIAQPILFRVITIDGHIRVSSYDLFNGC
jgi:hypothetical protein